MTKEEVFTKIQAIVSEQLNVAKDKVTMESDLVEDLQADSIDTVEIIVQLEETFNISVSDEDATGIKTVGDLVNAISEIVK